MPSISSSDEDDRYHHFLYHPHPRQDSERPRLLSILSVSIQYTKWQIQIYLYLWICIFSELSNQQIKMYLNIFLYLNVLLCQYVDDLARLKLSKERLLKSSQIYFFVLLQRPETRLLPCWLCCYRGQYPAPQQLYSSKSIWRQCKTNACYQLQATAAAVSGAVFIIRTPAPTHSVALLNLSMLFTRFWGFSFSI